MYLIADTRGGKNRAHIIQLLSDRPRNANPLATELDVEYNTVRHHLEMLVDHDVVEAGGSDYGELYFLTEQFEDHRTVGNRRVGTPARNDEPTSRRHPGAVTSLHRR